ncbi:MAG: hypothetical protein ISS58_04120 [Dehalococcoidales bacterium]|nr:hypothetical protein [Dehalococcoidales bacterium]
MAGLISFCLLGAGCAATRDFNKQLSQIVRPYRFHVAQWEASTVFKAAKQAIWNRHRTPGDEMEQVKEYFDAVERMKILTSEIEAIKAGNRTGELASLEAELMELQQKRSSLVNITEKVITGQIKQVLFQQGIYHPADKYIGLKMNFPPMDFKLEKPPHLLVISPRDRIESMREIVLRQEIKAEEMEQIEKEVDALGVSSIVVGLGGFGGTYPAFVTNEASLRFTVDAAAEEWLHQYLFFKPLGFRYVLDVIGVARNYEVATMNETVASMISKEIGGMVTNSYYPDLPGDETKDGKKSGFDFDREMREIRRAVDEYLARGEIEQAEEFMEEKRQYLASKGYHIRKLNQAYFAFYGAYADQPTSISPIGDELKRLREQSPSLKEFLSTVSSMTSREDLLESLE